MKVLIDNGHGADTPGKCSPDGRLREYAYTRDIADRAYSTIWKYKQSMIRTMLTYCASRLDEYLSQTRRQPEGLATVGLTGNAAAEHELTDK